MAKILVVGSGPAGLMAADAAAAAGADVTLCEAMASAGRKFLLAGRSGLNITHAEPVDRFMTRYGERAPALAAALDAFPPEKVRGFAEDLGSQTFTGSSGRVFPRHMKASPLLRAWLSRLAGAGVRLAVRHRLRALTDRGALFDTPDGPRALDADAVVLALGGASWPRLGTDGSWVEALQALGIEVRPLRPANCGFDVAWSAVFAGRFAGAPVKAVTADAGDGAQRGEFVVTANGIEGSLVYALSARLRDLLEQGEPAALTLDLCPDRDEARLAAGLVRAGRGASLSTRLRKGAGLEGVKAALVRELAPPADLGSPERLAARLKALRLPLQRTRPIAEAISSAGGVAFAALDERLMARARPGLFLAGEMLDWEAPTGGYLITACMATGRLAGEAAAAFAASAPRQ